MRRYMDIVRETFLTESIPAFYEDMQYVADRMASEYQSGTPHQPWQLVPAARLVAIWQRAAKLGFVQEQDEAALDEIAERMIENTMRIYINTELAGHMQLSAAQYIERYQLEIDDVQRFIDWAVDLPTGGWRISDYGLEPLVKYAAELLDTPNSDEKLVIIDKMLNITHQRSDLASWFVEGGRATLNRLRDA